MPFSPRLRQVESEPTSDPDAPPARSDAPPTPVRLRGRVIGFVAAGVFRRTLRPEHYLRKPHAIALDEDVLVELGQLGVDLLVFTDAESGVMYSATLDRFWSASFGIDRGAGRQRAMVLRDFHSVEVHQVPLPGLEDVLRSFVGLVDE